MLPIWEHIKGSHTAAMLQGCRDSIGRRTVSEGQCFGENSYLVLSMGSGSLAEIGIRQGSMKSGALSAIGSAVDMSVMVLYMIPNIVF